MNVRLAVQTISSSIADAIEYLKCQNYSRFIGSEVTIEFLRIFDRLFDMMNARNCQGKHFKSPMSPHNLLHFKEVFLSFREYIQSLKINDVKGMLKPSVLPTFVLISFFLIAFIDLKILFHN